MKKKTCPLISVVVPVYNVEKYLRRCLDSILKQTYSRIEIICVEDGSPDNCGVILDDYAIRDTRLKVIHQKNQGSVGARQAAINVATGKYLAFVDSDDYIHPEMLEHVLYLAEKEQFDITWCNVKLILKEENHLLHKVPFNTDADIMIRRLLNGQVQGWLCNKFIRTDYWKECHLIYDIRCCVLEDVLISLQLLCHKPKMGYADDYLYYYDRTNDNAYTSDKSSVSPLVNATGNVEQMYEYLVNNHLWNCYQSDFNHFAMKVKFALLSTGDIHKARRFMSFAHKSPSYYGLKSIVAMIYWFVFNGGRLGELLLEYYLKLKHTTK